MKRAGRPGDPALPRGCGSGSGHWRSRAALCLLASFGSGCGSVGYLAHVILGQMVPAGTGHKMYNEKVVEKLVSEEELVQQLGEWNEGTEEETVEVRGSL